jgi:hypothetical protein
MNTRFIEMDSTHRNRNRFPVPSSFVAPFSSSPTIAQDPVLNGAIYYTWTSDYHPTVMHPLKSGSTNSSPKLYVSNSSPQPSRENYYNGYIMSIVYQGGHGMQIVTEYDPSSVGVTLNNAFSFDNHTVQAGDMYSLFEMNTPSMIHLPIVDSYSNDVLNYTQAYDGYYVMDETLSYGTSIVARRVEEYDSLFRYCHLDSPFPFGWSYTDSYTLRKSLPSEKWTLSSPTTTNNKGLLVFTFPLEASATDRFYVGKYVYFSGNVMTNEKSQFKAAYGTYLVIEYNGYTRKAVCYSSGDNNNPVMPPTTGDTINIVSFSYDNFSPIMYNGSVTSQNQTVCYEISLVSLILPNVTLDTGSRIAFYPYVYVELSNVTTPSGMSRNIIYSNNPESGRALFIIGISDVVQPLNSQFVKLLGRMRQTVKFKPNDSLRFSVYLPDGKLFTPVKKDLFSPYEPDRHLQINAVFSIRRV